VEKNIYPVEKVPHAGQCIPDMVGHSEPKTKDDILLEILAPLGTEIPDPTGEYADLFAYLYDKISPLLSNDA
jgi:hypothetical protein